MEANDEFSISGNDDQKSVEDSKEGKVELRESSISSPTNDVTAQDFPDDPFSDLTITDPESLTEWNDPAFLEDPFKSNPDRLSSTDPFNDSFNSDPFFREEEKRDDPFSASFSHDPFSESFPNDPFLESSQQEPFDPFLNESSENPQKSSDPFLDETSENPQKSSDPFKDESSENPHPFKDDIEWKLKLTEEPKELQTLLENYSFILGKLEKERKAQIIVREIEIEEKVELNNAEESEDDKAENKMTQETEEHNDKVTTSTT